MSHGFALITGGTTGIGAAFARLLPESTNLLLVARNEERLSERRAELERSGRTVETVAADLSTREGRDKLLDKASECEIDLLINNAGAGRFARVLDNDPDDELATVELNVVAPTVLTRALLPGMIERGRGHVVNIGSTAGNYPYPGGNVYCASKAFVKQFSLALRADLQGTGVRVTNVEPGMVETDFSLVRFKGDAEKAGKVYADTTPLTADDVAEAVFWAATLPPHFNVNRLEIMPTTQAFGPLAIHRSK